MREPRPPVPHDHVRLEGCYQCVWPEGTSAPPALSLKLDNQPEAHQVVKLDGSMISRHMYLSNDLGWIELGYEEGSIEFTIVQITLHGDYRLDRAALERIYGQVMEEIRQ